MAEKLFTGTLKQKRNEIYAHLQKQATTSVRFNIANMHAASNTTDAVESFCCACMAYEPRCEITVLWGFRPGPTKTRLYNHRRWLED